jgi:ATP-dependent DNA helicase PIF1
MTTSPTLAPQQQAAYDTATTTDRSLLITGNGGTGKSFLLEQIKKKKHLTVTASTGIAAINVGGCTIHSWTGLGIGNIPVDKLIQKLRRDERDFKSPKLQRLIDCRVLAIDEISMLEGGYFTLIDELLRKACFTDLPFGGKQLIMLGDFLQLPPISRDSIPKFVFETPAWHALDPEVHMLTQTFRQADQEFANILNDIRLGQLTEEGRRLLNECFTREDPEPTKPGVILHTHNEGCDDINRQGLEQCVAQGAKLKVYTSKDTGITPTHIQQLDKNCLAPFALSLCPGARVMLLKNLDTYSGLANGSMGIVQKCFDDEVWVEFDNGTTQSVKRATWELLDGEELLAQRSQIPLRLAWAVTVHKSQGMSLDKVYCHLDKCFSPGQAYVALSRARNREGLFIRGSTQIKINANLRAVNFYRQHANAN